MTVSVTELAHKLCLQSSFYIATLLSQWIRQPWDGDACMIQLEFLHFLRTFEVSGPLLGILLMAP